MFSGSSEEIGYSSYPVVINDGTGDKFLPVVEVIDVTTSTTLCTSEPEDTGIRAYTCILSYSFHLHINKIHVYIICKFNSALILAFKIR